ncbi:MAG: di-heme enzyme [Myxococcales bacterium]|nr:di-heme enzyme [Myxococcales bacterium]MCB9668957.1 di-heme enzyme [Alphaproteobacteria bacterium]MCB9691284.1 di-heme enzyme [Alphaproteobacteria bacterium]
MLALAWLACTPAPEGYVLEVPEGFPQPAIPEANPLSDAKIELGRHLFYDERLSGNGEQACASCHHQELAFTDGRTTGLGSTGEAHFRNANSLTNVAYNSTLTWANPLLVELEVQMLVPLFGDAPVELGASPGEDAVLARLTDDPALQTLHEDAFPERPMDWDTVVMAIASFERTLISGDSPFDRYAFQNDPNALSEAELRGLDLFLSERLECHHCHGGFNFTEASVHAASAFDASFFQNTGLYDVDGMGAYPARDTGVMEVTGDPADMGRFRAPSLRNVALTAPYMHDGSMETLEEVVRHYERGGRLIEDGPDAGDGAESPLRSGLVPGFTLTDAERADLLAFLNALTDTTFTTDPRFADPEP